MGLMDTLDSPEFEVAIDSCTKLEAKSSLNGVPAHTANSACGATVKNVNRGEEL